MITQSLLLRCVQASLGAILFSEELWRKIICVVGNFAQEASALSLCKMCKIMKAVDICGGGAHLRFPQPEDSESLLDQKPVILFSYRGELKGGRNSFWQ